jgi:phosphate-selective porin OprO/OprP
MFKQTLRTLGIFSCLLLAVSMAGGMVNAADSTQAQIDALQDAVGELKQSVNKMGGDTTGCKIKSRVFMTLECEKFTAQMFGRIHFDATWYNDDKTAMGSGTEFRRARIGMKGKMYKNWGYKMQVDLADNAVSAKDLYVEYLGLKKKFNGMKIKVGNQKVPFSLAEMTSSKYQNFQERAYTDDIQWIPGRAEGIAASWNGETWSFAAGWHGEHVSVGDGDETDEGWGIAGRLTMAPVYDKKANNFVHTGLSVRRWQKQGDNTAFTDFDDQPHSHQTTVNYLNTGVIPFVDSYTVVGPELAFGRGPWGMQAEYFMIDVNRDTNDDLDFWASYVEGWYYVTGEGRSYKPNKGTFGRIKPKKNFSDGGPGALGLAVRYAAANHTDGDVQGGGQHTWTGAVNWHANPYIVIRAEYIRVMADNDAVNGGDEPSIFQMRMQIDW